MKTILIVDDRDEVAQLASFLFEDGYHIEHITDAKAALTWLADRPCDLVLLDYKMPGMNGYEFMLKHNEIRTGPVVVCSGSEMSREKFRDTGVRDFLIKPFKIPDLLKVVQEALGDE